MFTSVGVRVLATLTRIVCPSAMPNIPKLVWLSTAVGSGLAWTRRICHTAAVDARATREIAIHTFDKILRLFIFLSFFIFHDHKEIFAGPAVPFPPVGVDQPAEPAQRDLPRVLPVPARRSDAIVIGAGVAASFAVIPIVVILCGIGFVLMWYADDAARRKAARDR